MHEQESGISPEERARASELVVIAARARRAFPRGGPDITETQVLLALAAVGVGRGVNETAVDLGLDASTVSHAIRHLRDQGLISAAAYPADGRRRAYALTAAGEHVVFRYLRAAESV